MIGGVFSNLHRTLFGVSAHARVITHYASILQHELFRRELGRFSVVKAKWHHNPRLEYAASETLPIMQTQLPQQLNWLCRGYPTCAMIAYILPLTGRHRQPQPSDTNLVRNSITSYAHTIHCSTSVENNEAPFLNEVKHFVTWLVTGRHTRLPECTHATLSPTDRLQKCFAKKQIFQDESRYAVHDDRGWSGEVRRCARAWLSLLNLASLCLHLAQEQV